MEAYPARSNNSSTVVLGKIVQLADRSHVRFKQIQELINESTSTQLVPVIAWFGFWFISNTNSTSFSESVMQTAARCIDAILRRVPPVILLSGLYELNWNSHYRRFLSTDFFRSICTRVQIIKDFVRPFSIESHALRWLPCFPHRANSILQGVRHIIYGLEPDPRYQGAHVDQFQRLILEHAHVGAFKPLLEYTNGKILLTVAIRNLIQKVNLRRDMRHEQLLFVFYTIFNYVQAFSRTNEVDAQLIAETIRRLPTVSPFCLLAIVTHIQQTFPLFTLLVPPALGVGDLTEAAARQVILDEYRIVDLSMDDSLDGLIEQVPEILVSYFTSNLTRTPATPDSGAPPLRRMQFAAQLPYSPMMLRRVIDMLSDAALTPCEFLVWRAGYVRAIMSYVRTNLRNSVAESKPPFWDFLGTAIASEMPLIGFLAGRFLEEKSTEFREFLARGLLKYAVKCLVAMPVEARLIPWLLENIATRSDRLMAVSRLLLVKLLRSSLPRLTQEGIDQIVVVNDVVVTLEYTDALRGFSQVDQSDELVFARDALDRLRPLVGRLQTPPISELYKKKPFELLVAGRLLCTPDVTRATVDALMNFLKPPDSDAVDYAGFGPNFGLKASDYIFPVAQFALQLLADKHQHELVSALLDRMENFILADQTPLAWVSSFLAKNYVALSDTARAQFRGIVARLPDAERYFVPEGPDQVRRMMVLLGASDLHLEQDPAFLTREAQSQLRYVKMWCLIALLVRNDSAAIVSDLLKPFRTFEYGIEKKEKSCAALAMVIGSLPQPLAFGFFKEMMGQPFHEFTLVALRYFMAFISIDVLRQICEKSGELLARDDKRLSPFMFVVLPVFNRLASDDETTKNLLVGLLETVNQGTPIQLQERVIDAVGLVYVVFRLAKHRADLIRAARDFADELKAIIPSSLDVDFDFDRSQEQQLRTKPGNMNGFGLSRNEPYPGF
jgi:hypothetical protein